LPCAWQAELISSLACRTSGWLAGIDILKDIEFPWLIASMVLQHHERQDGSGYRQGLQGEQILLSRASWRWPTWSWRWPRTDLIGRHWGLLLRYRK